MFAVRAVAFAAAMIAAGAAAAQGPSLTPGGAGARSHFAPRPAEAPEDSLLDTLEARLWETVRTSARASGVATPALDPRLAAVARALARASRGDTEPSIDVQEFLLSHYGLGDPPPYLISLRVSATDAAIANRVGELIADALPSGRFSRVGIGVQRRAFWSKSVVVALQRSYADMLPVPRQLPPDGSAMIAGQLRPGLAAPRVLWAPPSGEVRNLSVRTTGDSFQAIFRCEGLGGRHRVQVTGMEGMARTALVNFPVWCGVAPPASISLTPAGGLETMDPREGESLALLRVNEDRSAAGLQPLRWDEALARVARAHSEAMAIRQQVSHVLPDSGNAADRLRRAGVSVNIVLENVARAPSITEAQRSFMSSPGHRANVLSRLAKRLGAGVYLRTEPNGARTVYVTQLFAP